MSKRKKITYPDAPDTPSLLEEPGMIELVREGLSFKEFLSALKLSPFNIKEWAKLLHLSERTLQRYENAYKSFEPLQSERILEIKRLNVKGVNVFGSNKAYRGWLEAPSIALGGVPPISLLDSAIGIHMVYDELGRIEHGIYS